MNPLRHSSALDRMVSEQIEARGVRDAALLAALRRVDRAAFVPAAERAEAYADHPLGIGEGQTISQPFIVALMTEALAVEPGQRILEIGVGSGYQTALLLELGAEVYGIERIHPLTSRARLVLRDLGYARFHLITADGTLGWPLPAAALPARGFDRIIVAAAAPRIPSALRRQLAPGGRLVIPVGDRGTQDLLLVTRDASGRLAERTIELVRFVPLLGAEGY